MLPLNTLKLSLHFTGEKHKSLENPVITIGLASGSGSSRGWAHIGIIRALSEIWI
jgi:predicted acylesterase/phospholipase RssA